MAARISATKYLAVFAITTLIFLVGIIIGNIISTSKISDIIEMQQALRTKILAIELQYDLLAEEPCSAKATASEELYEIGSRLDHMESTLGKDNEDVIRLKEYYSLLELRHWLFTEKIKEECSTNTTSLIYFYSNTGDCDKCEEQGFILSYLHKKLPNINIYSFDINIEDPALKALKELYNITTTPTIMINKKVHTGFMNLTQLSNSIITS